MPLRIARLVPLISALAACAPTPGPAAPAPAGPPARAAGARAAAFELVETVPIETTLDHPELRDAADVWPEMIAAARTSIDLGQFYASNQQGSRLEPVVRALEATPSSLSAVTFAALHPPRS